MLATLGRLFGTSKSDHEGFDPVFYRSNYLDLHLLTTPAELLRHYRRHGKEEGRFASAAAARSHFESINGPPPEDFDVSLYEKLNPDLSKIFSDPIQYELHFLEFGRFESRPYATLGRPEDNWHYLLNVHDFNLLNESWLPRGGVERAEAVVRMEAEGIDRLAPIARRCIFDPAFYRAHYGIEGDDAALYRDWLHAGFAEGRAPNEVQAISGLLSGRPYPECFDWQNFCRVQGIKGSAPYPAKLAALEQVFDLSADAPSHDFIAGPGAGRLFEAIGNYHLIRAHFREAAHAFHLAIEKSEPTARLHLLLGDSLKALDKWQDALASYRHALTLPGCPIWALIHAVKIMLSQKMFRDAFELVEAHTAHFRANELFDGFIDEVANTVFGAVSDTMHSMIADDKQDEVLDSYSERRLGEITAFLQKLKIGKPLHLAATSPRRVIMLACLDVAQCTFYRVEQKRRLLAERDIEVDIYDFNDPTAFMSALPGAAAAVFYRVPCYPKIVESILYARSLGIETLFDIDDLVFTRDFPDSFESYENQISRQEYFGLCHGVALYRHAISLCDAAIVSTRPLAEMIAPIVLGGAERSFVVPNGLDDRSEPATRFAENQNTTNGPVSIFYGSGTKAHNRDFSDIVAPALLEVLASHPSCRLVIVGYLSLDKRFGPYAERITRFPFIADVDTYWALLASCDINISVLHEGAIADGKSEIKWLEAAMLGLPSIVSATRTFQDVLADGETGLLAHGIEDWRRHLRALIENGELRQTIGRRAREVAMREYSGAAIATKLEAALLGREARTRDPDPRKRILICNVFFSPQSYGGATRVVEDNVEHLIDRYGDEFAISVLSTYKGLSVGALRVDNYRGRPVYRIGTPLEVNMDWRPFNDAVLPAFRRVLEVEQPHLIHFHCVQRLTASIVEETLGAAIPYIVTVHDAWWISDHQFLIDQDDRPAAVDDVFESKLPSGVTRLESIRRSQRLKSLLNNAVTTLAVSRSFAKLYREAGISNTRTCENGVSPLGPPLMKNTPKDRVVLGHIGGRSAHKGASLVEVVLRRSNFQNLELILIDGTLDVGDKVVERWGSTQVTIRAPVASAKVDQLYSEIDVLLVPSIWPESYGLVVREALHFRTWVVASDRGALAQDIIEGENGFVIDPSNLALAALLEQIDGDVTRFKKPPQETTLRHSSQQLDEIVSAYRETLERTERPASGRFSSLSSSTRSGNRGRDQASRLS